MSACSNFYTCSSCIASGVSWLSAVSHGRVHYECPTYTSPPPCIICRGPPGAAGVGFLMPSVDLAIRARASAHFLVLGGQRNRCVGVLRLNERHSTTVSSCCSVTRRTLLLRHAPRFLQHLGPEVVARVRELSLASSSPCSQYFFLQRWPVGERTARRRTTDILRDLQLGDMRARSRQSNAMTGYVWAPLLLTMSRLTLPGGRQCPSRRSRLPQWRPPIFLACGLLPAPRAGTITPSLSRTRS